MRSAPVAPPELLSVAGHVVKYGDTMMQVEDIGVIGEYTTPNGPWEDDYFVVFVDRDGKRLEVPDTAFTPAATDELRRSLGSDFAFGLANSTDFNSRILWPPKFAGKPLYVFTKVPARGFTRRVLQILGGREVQLTLTRAAEEAMAAPRVLVLTDPREMQHIIELVRGALEHHDAAIENSSGDEAVDRISEQTYKFLVVDLQSIGLDVLEEIRGLPQSPDTIVVNDVGGRVQPGGKVKEVLRNLKGAEEAVERRFSQASENSG